jgi:hypothetical protein
MSAVEINRSPGFNVSRIHIKSGVHSELSSIIFVAFFYFTSLLKVLDERIFLITYHTGTYVIVFLKISCLLGVRVVEPEPEP